ncbi:hypothetical protein HHUSO_G25086 [Huso huso]|uniref:Uncharacterized protein n=1 Tax=Huso huso TaxID=61971 RepID=A0ABR0YT27_HUSHU
MSLGQSKLVNLRNAVWSAGMFLENRLVWELLDGGGEERRGEERRSQTNHIKLSYAYTQIATGIEYTETHEIERRGRVPGINAEDVSNNGGDVIAAAWSECGTERAKVFPGHAAPPS